MGRPLLLLLLASLAAVTCAPRAEQHHEVLSPVYSVDREYRSMQGPQSTQVFSLAGAQPELLWITGYRATMVGADGASRRSQEFMCHSNLNVTPEEHSRRFGGLKHQGGRLFTLSQGQVEVELPRGFGIPVSSDEPLRLTTQVLNMNWKGETARVRHKVDVRYVREAERPGEMRPLFMRGVYGLALLEGEDGYFGLQTEAADPELHGPGCLLGENAAEQEYRDPEGRRFTGHWRVPPGRQENRTLVTRLLDLPYDTTVHYIAVHLHPFAESIELRDLTTGESVFRSTVEAPPERIGISRVEHFSSRHGLPLYRGHEYEVVSVYDNPTDTSYDAMAVLYLYLLDREFEPPRLAATAAPAS